MDKEWVQSLFDQLGEFGKTERGYNRLAYSEADWQAKKLIMKTMQDLGMTAQMDAIGNIIGRLEGSDINAPAVAAGSHVDSVPEGGNYDGAVGVIGALCAIKRLKEKKNLRNPLEVWVFAGHESSRFGLAHLGSRSLCGTAEPEKWATMKDNTGNTIPNVLASRNLDFNKIPEVKLNPAKIKSFMELHIEQGPVLENSKIPIGIVTDIAAPIRLSIKVFGKPAHSGTTPMDSRHDSLVTASNIVLAVRKYAAAAKDRGIVGTVGMMQVKPGAMNVVPGFVEMWVDIRGITLESLTDTIEKVKSSAKDYAVAEGTRLEIDIMSSGRPVHLDDNLMEIVKMSCKKLNLSYTYMIGGGGHDSQNIGQIIPTAVIHIPCRDGVSHVPEEYADIEDIMVGIDVLTDAMEKLAMEK